MEEIVRQPGGLDDALGGLFKGFFVRPVGFEGQPEIKMRVDVRESDKVYTVRADVPGAKKEDIQVTVEGNVVTIRAEVRKSSMKEDGGKLLRSERYEGVVSRSFSLPEYVDVNAVQAKYLDGVLDLTLPKKPGAGVSRLTVQ